MINQMFPINCRHIVCRSETAFQSPKSGFGGMYDRRDTGMNPWRAHRMMRKTDISRCSKLTDMTILIICYLYLCLILCALQVFIPKSHRPCSPLHSLFGLWNATPEQHPIWWQLILNIYSEKYQNETWHGMVAGFIFNNGAATVLLCIAWMFFPPMWTGCRHEAIFAHRHEWKKASGLYWQSSHIRTIL